MTQWTTNDIPDQTGRTAVITGANTGLGYEAAAALAAKGALSCSLCETSTRAKTPPRSSLKGGDCSATARSPSPPIPVARSPSFPATFPSRCASPSRPLELQGADMGALPALRAATDPGVLGGQYYGPDGFFEMRGYPKVVSSSDRSHDVDVQKRLWTVSEELTGVVYPLALTAV